MPLSHDLELDLEVGRRISSNKKVCSTALITRISTQLRGAGVKLWSSNSSTRERESHLKTSLGAVANRWLGHLFLQLPFRLILDNLPIIDTPVPKAIIIVVTSPIYSIHNAYHLNVDLIHRAIGSWTERRSTSTSRPSFQAMTFKSTKAHTETSSIETRAP